MVEMRLEAISKCICMAIGAHTNSRYSAALVTHVLQEPRLRVDAVYALAGRVLPNVMHTEELSGIPGIYVWYLVRKIIFPGTRILP